MINLFFVFCIIQLAQRKIIFKIINGNVSNLRVKTLFKYRYIFSKPLIFNQIAPRPAHNFKRRGVKEPGPLF